MRLRAPRFAVAREGPGDEKLSGYMSQPAKVEDPGRGQLGAAQPSSAATPIMASGGAGGGSKFSGIQPGAFGAAAGLTSTPANGQAAPKTPAFGMPGGTPAAFATAGALGR